MTTTIKLSEFFRYTKIDYQEDLYNQVYIGDTDVAIDDILYNLRSPFDGLITKDIIDSNTLLLNALQRAYNRAYESGVVSACHSAQDKEVEAYAHKLVEVVNQVTDNALVSISIDWPNEQVVIEYNAKEASQAIFEILNGEGMFCFESVKDFVESYDGALNYDNAVTSHLHYLLNEKLIQNIYGFVKSCSFDWRCDDCDFDKDYFAECISDELAEIDIETERAEIDCRNEKLNDNYTQLKTLKLIK